MLNLAFVRPVKRNVLFLIRKKIKTGGREVFKKKKKSEKMTLDHAYIEQTEAV